MARGLISVFLLVYSAATAAETTLTLVSSWNRQQNFTALFMDYVDAVNAAGKGVVQIDFRGGPEVIPQRQLLYALRRGVIDMAFGGITYYRGVLPEGDAMFASTITPMEARRSGRARCTATLLAPTHQRTPDRLDAVRRRRQHLSRPGAAFPQ